MPRDSQKYHCSKEPKVPKRYLFPSTPPLLAPQLMKSGPRIHRVRDKSLFGHQLHHLLVARAQLLGPSRRKPPRRAPPFPRSRPHQSPHRPHLLARQLSALHHPLSAKIPAVGNSDRVDDLPRHDREEVHLKRRTRDPLRGHCKLPNSQGWGSDAEGEGRDDAEIDQSRLAGSHRGCGGIVKGSEMFEAVSEKYGTCWLCPARRGR